MYKSFLIKQINNQERIPKGLSRQKWLEEVWEKSCQELHNAVRMQQEVGNYIGRQLV